MTGKKREKECEATPKGAVEVDEKDLDQAAGGLSVSGGSGADALPLETVSLNYSKISVEYKPERPPVPPKTTS